LSLGTPQLARHWEFANATVSPGRTQTMVIANPATVPSTATIRTRLDGGVLEPETVSLPAQTAIAVDLGRRVPAGVGFSVAVTSKLPLVAESFVSVQAPQPRAYRGIATMIGTNRSARRWVDAPAHSTATSQDSISVLNPGSGTLTFRLSVTRAGKTSVPPTTERVTLAAGKRKVLDLGTLKVPADAFVTVDATGPVVVERESAAMPGITIAGAVPDLNR
jgi:hypothetical protein